MLLTRTAFDQLIKENRLGISLIGMSGMGKTYRSKQLKALGFKRHCSDDYIEARLNSLPGVGIAGVAEWMGQPYEPRHRVHCAQYLALEERSISSFLRECSTNNTVIDTTGSVIYFSPPVHEALKQQTLIVYLEASQKMKDELFHVYMTDPKPVVWGENFHKLPGESGLTAMKRCYPQMLEYRAARYGTLADITLPYEIARNERSDGEKFLHEIRHALIL